MRRGQRALVGVLAAIILLGSMPTRVYAEDANTMGAALISFFKSSQEDIDVGQIKASELRVYGVFLSNFFKPGETKISDLRDGGEIAGKVSQVFFGGGNVEKVKEVNKKVYDGLIGELKSGKLKDSGDKDLTGEGFLKEMSKGGKVKRGGKVVLDFSKPAYRGAMKILGAYSGGFILDSEVGLVKVQSMYVDCYGNIWGSYGGTVKVGETEEEGEGKLEDMRIIMPACINPTSFMNTNGGNTTAKLPLNNSFAMGSLVDSDNIDGSIGTDGLVGYYNIPKYLGDGDKENALYIYGVNSPFSGFMNTETLKGDEVGEKYTKFFEKGYTRGADYKLVLGNRLDVMKKTLESDKNWVVKNKDKVAVIQYLYGTMTISLTDTMSTIYYFGDSGNASWADTTFEDVGLVGVNMYGEKHNGVLEIHDKNQKATKMIQMMEEEGKRGKSIKDLRTELGVTGSYIEDSEAGVSSIDKLGYYEVTTAWLNIFGGDCVIHGVDEKKDKSVQTALEKRIKRSGEEKVVNFKAFGGGKRELELFHTLHSYVIAGAKVTGSKERDSAIKIDVGGVSKEVAVTNNRVGTEGQWPGVFWGYMVEMLDMETMVKEGEDGKAIYDVREYDNTNLPSLTGGVADGGKIDLKPLDGESGVYKSEKLTMEEMQKDLLKKVHNLVSDDRNEYRSKFFRNALNDFLIDTHKTITGSSINNITTVSSENASSYAGITGYIHTPKLTDMPATAWILNNYMEIYVLVMVFVMFLVVAMVLLNMRSWQDGLVIFMLMGLCMVLPVAVVDNTVRVGNKVTDTMYSDRFDFWAITQHQQAFRSLKGAEDSGSIDAFLNVSGEKAKNIYSQESGVRLKWMAPKKSGMFSSLYDRMRVTDRLATNLTVFRWLFSSFVYEQEFDATEPFATYLYRPYNAIAADALEYYRAGMKDIYDESGERISVRVKVPMRKGEKEVVLEYPRGIGELVESCQEEGNKKYQLRYLGSGVWGGENKELKKGSAFEIFWSEDKWSDVRGVGQYPSEQEIEKRSVSTWGTGQKEITRIILEEGRKGERVGPGIPKLPKDISKGVDAELLGFYKNTESPYYYFYNTLKVRYGGTSGETFKNALLNSDVYKVRKTDLKSSGREVNGLLRDFLDLEGLFTNIVPYMQQSNDYVKGWTSVYGTKVPDFAFPTEGEVTGDIGEYKDEITDEEEVERKTENAQVKYTQLKELKQGMEEVWGMYCPWVDQLTSLDTRNKKVGGSGLKRLRVEDTLNPGMYVKAGRPMIFSEADMVAKGYRPSDLSDIEIRMQRVLDKTYTDLQYLVNYYDMDNEVLVSAAAMYATFNFNAEFSDNMRIGKSVNLYPQGFEMKNFNQDAFMRLMLLNATGESVFADKGGDLYDKIFLKTSWFTGFLLVANDILGVIGIPGLKLVVLIVLLLNGILKGIASVIDPPMKIVRSVFRDVILPALKYLAVTVGFAFIVSLFVGEGLTTYVGSKNINIETQDPTIALGMLLFVNGVYIVILWKLLQQMVQITKTLGMGGVFQGIGIIGGGVTRSGGRIVSGVKGATGMLTAGAVGGAIGGYGWRGIVEGMMSGNPKGVIRDRIRDARQRDMFAGMSGVNRGETRRPESNVGVGAENVEMSASPEQDTGIVEGQRGNVVGKLGVAAVKKVHEVHGDYHMIKEGVRSELKVAGSEVERYKREVDRKWEDYGKEGSESTSETQGGNSERLAEKVRRGVGTYVTEAKGQITEAQELEIQKKKARLNKIYQDNRGYTYEDKQKSQGVEGVTRQERREAQTRIRKGAYKFEKRQK